MWNAKLCLNYFSVSISVLAVVFRKQFSKNRQFWNCQIFENCWQNTTASTETFIENSLRRNFALRFASYLSIALSKILLHSKTIKTLRNCWYLVKTTPAVHLKLFYKFMFFETLIILLESTIKFITGYLISKSNNSYHDSTSAFFNVFLLKNPHVNAAEHLSNHVRTFC